MAQQKPAKSVFTGCLLNPDSVYFQQTKAENEIKPQIHYIVQSGYSPVIP